MINEDDYAKLILPATLEVVRVLPAPPERVWEYLVDPELRQLWFCAGETGSKPGEAFVMDFDHSRISDSEPPESVGCGDPITMKGTIVTFDPPNVLSWNWPEEDGAGTIVTIHLTAEGEGTRLHLTHERLTNPDFKKGASAGWHAHLDLLVDTVQGSERRDFWVHYEMLKDQYDQRIEQTSEG